MTKKSLKQLVGQDLEEIDKVKLGIFEIIKFENKKYKREYLRQAVERNYLLTIKKKVDGQECLEGNYWVDYDKINGEIIFSIKGLRN